jgi:polar amino acid transport system permease protein
MRWDLVWTSINWERLLVGDLLRGRPGGLLVTVAIAALSIVLSTVLGVALGAMRASDRRALRLPALLYIETLRNVPLLILVFWAYFVPPYFGVETSKFSSVVLAMTLFTAAYIAEAVRGGIRAVPQGNIEAARALGLGELRIQLLIVLPQACYRMIPAFTNIYITAVKNTSLAFLIGLSELTEIGKQINMRLLSAPVEVYATVAAIYFVVNRALAWAMGRLESLPTFKRVFLRAWI